MNTLARVTLGVSGLAAAALALLPALVAGLIALFDLSAHALLGTSGSLLGFAGSLVPGTGESSLPPYARIDVHPWLAALVSLARGAPPVAMVVLAVRPGPKGLLIAAAGLALVTDGLAGGIAAAPGAIALLAIKGGGSAPRPRWGRGPQTPLH